MARATKHSDKEFIDWVARATNNSDKEFIGLVDIESRPPEGRPENSSIYISVVILAQAPLLPKFRERLLLIWTSPRLTIGYFLESQIGYSQSHSQLGSPD